MTTKKKGVKRKPRTDYRLAYVYPITDALVVTPWAPGALMADGSFLGPRPKGIPKSQQPIIVRITEIVK